MEHASTVVLSNRRAGKASLRQQTFRILEMARADDVVSRIVDVCLIAIIALSVIAVVLESIPALQTKYSLAFDWFEIITVVVFTIEYMLRVWSSVENAPQNYSGLKLLGHRMRHVFSAYALIDLLAILPFYLLMFGLFDDVDMRFLRAVRLLRVLKLTRYSAALDMLVMAYKDNIRALTASFFILLTVMLLAASGIYFFERESQPVAFGSIPAAMWWACTTLTTVGYGDVTPMTAAGKIFGALITVIGIGMVALPTAILASGYLHQITVNSEKYKVKADQALADGILTEMEESDLEQLRIDLGLGKLTTSQILDTERVKLLLKKSEINARCPHCLALLGD